jgi:hypothetical protein
MPLLTYTNSGRLYAGLLNSRVLIGRRISHGVALDDPSVSRLHAWIDPIADENAQWVITDAGSKTGTRVNDQPIARHPLHDGDVILVGKITLTYHEQDVPPDDAALIVFSSPAGVDRSSGILFECACGAPLWVGSDLAGKRGICRHCRQPITVPGGVAAPTAAAVAAQAAIPKPVETQSSKKRPSTCAVCHSAILDSEEKTQCPDCAMTFHTECWQENFGCSSYGCPQVNVLQPAAEEIKKVAVEETGSALDPSPQTTPWETILLAASVVGSILGTLLFGSLAALVAVISAVVLLRGNARKPAMIVLAIIICLIGIAAGLVVSDFWYFNARHLQNVMHFHR